MMLTFSIKKKNEKKNKLSSTMLLLTLHAKHRKAIYPSSSLRDDKVGHEKTFEIQTTSEDILRRPTQDIVGTLQTPANNFSWTNTLNTIESNQLSLTKKDFGKKRASKKLNLKSQFKYFSWKLQNRTPLLIHRNMKQSGKWSSNYKSQKAHSPRKFYPPRDLAVPAALRCSTANFQTIVTLRPSRE